MLSAIVARDINLLQQLHVINNKMNFFGLITLLSFDNSILKIYFVEVSRLYSIFQKIDHFCRSPILSTSKVHL